jgi:transposase
MHLTRVINRNGVETVLVRESYREDGKVKKRTVANVTHLPADVQELIAAHLRGEQLVSPSRSFQVTRSRQDGHVEAVLAAMRRLKIDRLLASAPSRERSLVMAMIAARILEPASNLATTRWWDGTTLPTKLDVQGATEDELYSAMDWLLEVQPEIEKRLAKRHLEACGPVLYDLTSTYVEGTHCPLAKRGYSRDGKPDKLQITFGLMTDEVGRPISVSVFPGNTGDARTVATQVKRLKEDFNIDLLVLVGDRGMLAQTVIKDLKEAGGIEWITALKSGAIRRLNQDGALQMDLFDERGLFEIQSPRYPGERLVACRNPALAVRRTHKREELLEATKREIRIVQGMVRRGTLRGRAEIGVRLGRIINKYKMAKHFKVIIEDDQLRFAVRKDSVQAEAALDGIYIVRTSVPKEAIDTDDAVRHYKSLTRVEKTFRMMKMSGLEVRPIFHRTEDRVRAHIFLCMLAQYVQWHMQKAWASLLFAEEADTLPTRHPVEPVKPSAQVTAKKRHKTTDDGLPVHSFRSLLGCLASIVENLCSASEGKNGKQTFTLTTQPDALQRRAFDLIKTL